MAEANNFTMDTVLLGSESVGGEGCGKELKVHGQEKVEALAANEKLKTSAKTKRVVSDGLPVYSPGRMR